jgi:hypothetical protein
MSYEPTMIVRGLATLACLVGVPTIALVGIAGDGGSSVWKSAEAKTSAGLEEPVRRLRAANDAPFQPAAHHAQAIPKALPVTPAMAIEERGLAAPSVPATQDLMNQQFTRLQDLGATYYRLEGAPQSTADFFFHCRVAGVAQAFEASDRVATNAIADVLSQIEAAGVASRGSQRTETAAANGRLSIYHR